jgi:hypothetical protein
MPKILRFLKRSLYITSTVHVSNLLTSSTVQKTQEAVCHLAQQLHITWSQLPNTAPKYFHLTSDLDLRKVNSVLCLRRSVRPWVSGKNAVDSQKCKKLEIKIKSPIREQNSKTCIWLRHSANSRKVASLIPHRVIIVLESIQIVIKLSTMVITWSV